MTAQTEERVSRAAWRENESLRRLGACLFAAAVLALMTGATGSSADPAFAVTHSLLRPRILVFVVLGLALFALIEGSSRYGARLRTSLAPATAVRKRFFGMSATRYGVYLALLVLAIVLPLIVSNFWVTVLSQQIGIYVVLAIGLNVVVGFAGLLDLGYIAFFAIGAYTTAFFTGYPKTVPGQISPLPIHPPIHLTPFEVLPIAIFVCFMAGVILGAPTLRLRGDYLAIVTLGFGEIVRIVLVNSDNVPIIHKNFTNGPRGAFGIPHPSFHIGGFGYTWTLSQREYYWLLLGFILVLLFLFRRLEDSRVGRAWTAIREDEVAAAASGVPTVRFKLLAFAIGASTSGLAGVIFASQIQFISPENFPLLNSILVLCYVIFGGMGSLPGVVAGAAALIWLPNILRDYVPPQDRFIYFGALLVVMMIFRPQGMIPSRRRARELELAEGGIGGADAMGGPAGGAAR